MNAVVLAAAAEGGQGGGGAGLGLLLLVGLVVFLLRSSSGASWARWEYTRPDGQQAFTEWYDADTHYIWEDPHDPTRFEVRRRGES